MPALFAVAIVVFLEIVCLGAIIPTLPDFVTDVFGGSPVWIGGLFALVAAPKVVLNPLWGRLSDRLGRRPVLALLTVGAMSGSALWALSPTLGGIVGGGLVWLAISRGVYGIFSAQAAIAFAIASDTSTADKRAAAMGVLGAAFGVGLTVGFPLGAWVGEASLASVGWLCLGCETVALGLIAFGLRETRPTPAAPASREGGRAEVQASEHASPVEPSLDGGGSFAPETLFALLRRGPVAVLIAAVVVLWLGISVMTPTLRPLTERWYQFELMDTALAFAVWGVVGLIVQGGAIRPTVRVLGERRTFAVGVIMLAGSFFVVATHPGFAGFWLALVGMAVGGGLAIPALTGLLSLQVDPARQGAVHGVNQSATALGRTLGYLLGGAMFGQIGPASPYAAGAAVALLTLIPLFALGRRLHEGGQGGDPG
jgi:MFS family permease